MSVTYRTVGPKLILFLFVAMVGILFFGLLVSHGPPARGTEILVMMFVGAMTGLVFFGALWSGLFGELWIRSFFEATGLAIIAALMFFLGIAREVGRDAGSGLILVLLSVPLYAVALSLPLWTMRYLNGWRILSHLPPTAKARSMGIEDLFLATALVAGSIMLSRTGFAIALPEQRNLQSTWINMAVSCCVSSLISAPFSWIAAKVCFSSTKFDELFAKLFVFWLLSWFGFLLIVGLISRGRMPAEVVGYSLMFSMAAFGTSGIGIACFISDGNLLFRNSKKRRTQEIVAGPTITQDTSGNSVVPPVELHETQLTKQDPEAKANPAASGQEAANQPSAQLPPPIVEVRESITVIPHEVATTITNETAIDPFADEDEAGARLDEASESMSTRWLERLLVGGFVLTAVLFSAAAFLQRKRLNDAQEFASKARLKLIHDLESFGTIEEFDGALTAFTANSNTGDEVVGHLQEHRQVQRLDFSNSRIEDQGAATLVQLQNLQHLNLAGTNISDQVFDSIPTGVPRLRSLDLSHTKLTIAGLKTICRAMPSGRVNLQGLKLSAQELDELGSITTATLILDGELSGLPKKAKKLVLNQPNLPPESILELSSSIETLSIDGPPITDELFARFIKSHPGLSSLSVANTKLTGKSLAVLASLSGLTSLTIGPGLISEQDLVDHPLQVSILRLHLPELTGDCLKSLGSGSLSILDLSDSGITDQGIAMLQTHSLGMVNLMNTQVTIQGLKQLVRLGTREVNIRDTQITSDELATLGKFRLRLIIGANQFSSAGLAKLRSRTNIEFQLESLME